MTPPPRAFAEPVRLDVGCGARVRAGYVGVDVRPLPGVAVVCKAWAIVRHVAAHGAEEVYSRHFFEHLTFAEGRRTLAAFRRVLRPGGTLGIVVPDLRYHLAQLMQRNADAPSEANARWSAREHALAGFWGWQRDADGTYWDVHKSGYDAAMLGQALARAGFADIARLPDKRWNLSMRAIAAADAATPATTSAWRCGAS